MASFTMLDVSVHIAGHDFSTDSTELTVSTEVDDQETTTFQSGGWRSRIGGIRDLTANVSGIWQSGVGLVDPEAFTNLGVTTLPVTFSPTNATGDTAYFAQMGEFTYEIFGSVGEVAPFSIDMSGTQGADGLLRGLHTFPRGSVSATGVLGTEATMGAPLVATYLVVHTYSAGTTITLQVQSDDNGAFSSATTQGSTTITTAGGTWLKIPGAFPGETHWRVNVSAVTGTFNLSCGLAVV